MPGAIVGIAHHGEPIQVVAHGLRKSKSQVAITAETVHIGRTKAMTATLAARYVDRGLPRWDSTLEEVLLKLAGGPRGLRRDAARLPDPHRACRRTAPRGSPTGCPGEASSALAEANPADGPSARSGRSTSTEPRHMLAAAFERVGEGTWRADRERRLGPWDDQRRLRLANTRTRWTSSGPRVLRRRRAPLPEDNPEALGPAGRAPDGRGPSRFALSSPGGGGWTRATPLSSVPTGPRSWRSGPTAMRGWASWGPASHRPPGPTPCGAPSARSARGRARLFRSRQRRRRRRERGRRRNDHRSCASTARRGADRITRRGGGAALPDLGTRGTGGAAFRAQPRRPDQSPPTPADAPARRGRPRP